ncbi:carbohydrate kinase family protein [Kineothrix sp. MB12-C1]|uniref:carbohydrate kinase family protein n=1 Tax=Kineothrix sp. MB12-C1 TaxID=3070215 RepID=UPI0027D265D3|nr:PfkB family carbohydrate kinase [Kineothrix sp. MB12-C1]WMC93921.1 PfkB family carbohydrate kinase [Kineothrix sp. MB12-C1]
MKQYDVITSGYVSMDHIIKIATPAKVGFTSLVTNRDNARIQYGGCSVNIAYALCRLGKSALPLLRVGGDWENNGFKGFLENGRVPLDGIKVLPEETTSLCYLIQDNNNNHITIFYPGSMDGSLAEPVEDNLFQSVRLGVMTVASREDNRIFFEQCKKHHVPIVFGMKDDFDAFPEPFLREILTESDIIFTNEVEREIIEKLYGFKDITELFKIGRARVIVTTLGSEGSIYYERTSEGAKTEKIGVCPVEKVVDATGSGDSYMAGFLYGYLNGMNCAECCRMGSVLSWFVLQKEGCCTNLPTEEEFLKKYHQVKEDKK